MFKEKPLNLVGEGGRGARVRAATLLRAASTLTRSVSLAHGIGGEELDQFFFGLRERDRRASSRERDFRSLERQRLLEPMIRFRTSGFWNV